MIQACSFAAGAVFISLAIILFQQEVSGHGSPAGNILRVGLGVLSLFMGIFFVIVGTLYRMSFDEEPGNEFH